MSAEEAAAKADALIAQHRATTPQRKRAASVRVRDLQPRVLLDDRLKVFLVFVFGFLAGYQWHAARHAWSAVLAGLAAWSAFALVRQLRSDVRSPDDAEPTR